jgi:molybdate transport system regulatory protein
MAMSYSKGWKIIGSIEEQLGFEVVQRQQGGKNGGNASLTPKGQRILEKYIDFEKKAREMIRDMFEKMILNNEDF